jgi:hypothetical protein
LLGGIEKLKNITVTNNPPPSPFTKGGIITPPFSKGRLEGISLLTNIKGISVLFLVIAMVLMVTIGYVFSYLIPTKQKSVIFPIYSTQAFYLAQSGVEFGIRRAVQGPWLTPNLLNTNINLFRTLGPGRFTITYNCPTNTLTSIGAIPGVAPNVSERRITLSNFTSFLRAPTGLIIDPRRPAQCWNSSNRAQFYITNATETIITVTAFYATWGGGSNLRRIYMAGTQKYQGNRASSATHTNLNRPVGSTSQTITSDQTILVELYWNNGDMTETNIVIAFSYQIGVPWYDYIFYLNPCGTAMGAC